MFYSTRFDQLHFKHFHMRKDFGLRPESISSIVGLFDPNVSTTE